MSFLFVARMVRIVPCLILKFTLLFHRSIPSPDLLDATPFFLQTVHPFVRIQKLFHIAPRHQRTLHLLVFDFVFRPALIPPSKMSSKPSTTLWRILQLWHLGHKLRRVEYHCCIGFRLSHCRFFSRFICFSLVRWRLLAVALILTRTSCSRFRLRDERRASRPGG